MKKDFDKKVSELEKVSKPALKELEWPDISGAIQAFNEAYKKLKNNSKVKSTPKSKFL